MDVYLFMLAWVCFWAGAMLGVWIRAKLEIKP